MILQFIKNKFFKPSVVTDDDIECAKNEFLNAKKEYEEECIKYLYKDMTYSITFLKNRMDNATERYLNLVSKKMKQK